MRLARGILALGFALSAVVAAPAHAEPYPPADLAVWPAVTQGDAGVGKTVLAKLDAVDRGPNAVSYGTVTREVIAPLGTEITNEFDSSCVWVIPKRHVKCKQTGGFLAYSGGNFVNTWSIYLKITSPYVKPGRQKISWANDPKLSNNSAAIRVAGMPTASPKPPSPTPTTKASPSKAAAPTPSIGPTAEPSEEVAPDESSSEAAPVVAEPDSSSSSGMSTGGFMIGGIAILLGVSLLGGLLWRGRRRSLEEGLDDGS